MPSDIKSSRMVNGHLRVFMLCAGEGFDPTDFWESPWLRWPQMSPDCCLADHGCMSQSSHQSSRSHGNGGCMLTAGGCQATVLSSSLLLKHSCAWKEINFTIATSPDMSPTTRFINPACERMNYPWPSFVHIYSFMHVILLVYLFIYTLKSPKCAVMEGVLCFSAPVACGLLWTGAVDRFKNELN